MKKHYLIYIVFLAFAHTAKGQSNGCDGKRYLQEVFSEVKITTKTYGRNISLIGDTVDLNMDIYEPVGDIVTKRPALVLAFGGAFVSGDRYQLASLGDYFARHGYVVSCIDYRIWPVFVKGFPDSSNILDVAIKAVGDMRASIRYLKSQAASLKIDTNLVFVGGVSAGAITAIQTAYLNEKDNIPDFIQKVIDANGGMQGSSNNSTLQYSTKVRGVLNLSGAILDLGWIQEGEPPMASMHGINDNVVPFLQGKAVGIITLNGSGAINPVLKEKHIKELLVAVPGGLHTDIYEDPKYQNYVDSFRTAGKKLFFEIICSQIISSQTVTYFEPIKIYPTPATNFITIESDRPIRTIYLYDVTGRRIPSKLEGQRLEWGSGLVPGIYMLEAFLDNNKKAITKIMVR